MVSKAHRMCDLPATLIRAPLGLCPTSKPRRAHLGGALGASAFQHSLHQEGMVSKPAAVGTKAIANRVERLPVANASACDVADLRINDTVVTHWLTHHPCLPSRVVEPCARARLQVNFNSASRATTRTAHLTCTGTRSCSLHRGLLCISACSAHIFGTMSARAALGRSHRRGCHC